MTIDHLAKGYSSEIQTLKHQVEALETRQAFQDDLLDSLNKTVSLMQKELSDLWAANRLLKEQLRKMDIHSSSEGNEPPPPHY